MSKQPDFMAIDRREAGYEPAEKRLGHFHEFSTPLSDEEIAEQAKRCMHCGVPFCHGAGCPLGNNIPEFNELVARGMWRKASELLHITNNFPEFTGRLCPALCEASCVNAINGDATTIKQVELSIVEKAWKEGWIAPVAPEKETGKSVAVIGSGPCGLATAQQLRRAGHSVVLYEKAGEAGGVMRFGIPDFKLEKEIVERRVNQMKEEGVQFEMNVDVGTDISADYLKKKFDAICLTGGAMKPRDLDLPGRGSKGIYFAMEYLIQNNLRVGGEEISAEAAITAKDKNVVIVGGGDTGSDCLGVALRQGAKSVMQIELMPQPPEGENPSTPWPLWPQIKRTSTSHKEGGERRWSVNTKKILTKDDQVTGLICEEVEWEKDPETGRFNMKPVAGSEFELKADLVLLAMGFVRPVHEGLLDGLGVEYDARGNVKVDESMVSSVDGVFAAGDMQTGAWLVVGAIAGGRRMARNVDIYLMGDSSLPDVTPPTKL